MDYSILNDLEGFREKVIASLARARVDFLEQLQFIEEQRNSRESWEGAGVLLPLFFSPEQNPQKKGPGQYVFLLNKRSQKVQQAGDLCAPGGGIHPFTDAITQRLLLSRVIPAAWGRGIDGARKRGKALFRAILFFFGNALRESWEEVRLSPFNVEFFGPLPCYRLMSFRRIIFPLVGRAKRLWQPRLSWEVEKIVSIPVQAFFQPENYALYSLEVPDDLVARGIPNPWVFPCLVQNIDGQEEILWGATFNIIQSFLEIVFHEQPPSPDGRWVIQRPLVANYLSGNRER